jgi:uncharacterized protein YndB with AHSA1/START domain
VPPSPFHFARTWELDVPPDRFWDTISRTDEYRAWWPWLREFDADGVREGACWRAVIQSPLPYALRVDLVLDEVVEGERLSATVSGDIEGRATLDLAPAPPDGSAIDIEWDMRPRSRAMQMAAVLARPLLRWSHEWVLARGLDQFRQRALTQQPRSGDDSRPIRPSNVPRTEESERSDRDQ